MDLFLQALPYVGCFAAGIWVEWKYGAKLSVDNAAAHTALTTATAAVSVAAKQIQDAVTKP